MKAAIIDTLKKDIKTTCFSDLLGVSLSKKGVETHIVKTTELNIVPCRGCDGCLYKEPGRCIMKDNTSDVLTPITKSEILICLTELRFGGYSSDFKLIVDKFALLATPYYQISKEKLVHKKRYPNPKSMYVIGIADHFDEEQTNNFSRIVHMNAINLNIGIFDSFVFERKNLHDDTVKILTESVLKGDNNG